ncbi:hypothetical protein H0H87_009353 [Tephrocybe sp. NHM501043]|nr:hypothetical protein H0H87_009353 [Tephrocybe sp. NHM501043]
MSSDPGPIFQPQSLLSSSPSTSGAGSTSSNTQLSTQATAASLSPSTRAADSKDSLTTPEEHVTVSEKLHVEGITSPLEAGAKGLDQPGEVAEQHHGLQSMKEEGDGSLVPLNQEIELLERTPDSVVDEGQDWASEGDHELKRVKVYELIGARWEDQGTAFCFGQFQEETSEALLIARSERRYDKIILSTVIRSNDVYQRQQDTLIVWTEPDGVDYALSFQDPEGCAEVWSFICEVQQHMQATGASKSTL